MPGAQVKYVIWGRRMDSYRDRVILVTGGNSGIGRAFVDRFVAEGARVFTCGRNEATLEALKAAHAGVMERVDMLADGVDDAAIVREIAINLTAPILLTRRFLPLLRRGQNPLILMVTSGYALLPARRAPTYSATKAGLHSFTQALRYQLTDTGIRVVE